MGTINLTDPSNGTTADADLIANNNAVLEATINGDIDNANVASDAAIAVSKLAAGTNTHVLTTTGGVPVWAAPASTYSPPTPATTLPGSPTDGQQAILTDSTTAPSYHWLFQYESTISDAYKWMFIGGSPARATAGTQGQAGNPGSPQDLNGGTPAFTTPVAGYWDISYGARVDVSDANASLTLVNNGSGVEELFTAAPNGIIAGAYRALIGSGLVVKHMYNNTASGSATWAYRWINATPVRVS
jgi:hypothetical protein